MTFQRESTPPILVDALSTFCSRLNKRISLCTKIINSLLIIIPKIFHTYSMTLESFRLHLYFSHGLLHGGMNCVHCIPWEKKNQVTRDHISVLDLATKSTKSSPSPKKKVVQATLAFGKPKPSTPTKSTATDNKKAGSSGDGSHSSSPVKGGSDKNSKDNAFREFRRICARLAEEPSYNAKSKILADFFDKGSSGGTGVIHCLDQ